LVAFRRWSIGQIEIEMKPRWKKKGSKGTELVVDVKAGTPLKDSVVQAGGKVKPPITTMRGKLRRGPCGEVGKRAARGRGVNGFE